MLTNSNDKFGVISKGLHWIMAIMIIGLLGVGLYMTGLDQADPSRRELYGMHKAIGAIALLLVLVRITWILISSPPPLPNGLTKVDRILAKAVQGFLYLSMILIPISGYVMSTAAGYPISVFGLFELPMLFEKNKELADLAKDMHHLLGKAIIPLIVLHIAGAIKHRIQDKGGETDVLGRML